MHVEECTISPICMFYGFDEFFKKRDAIRKEVDCMDKNQIFIYRMYIYSTPFVTDYIRNNMWDFLMRYEDDLDMIKVYSDYKRNKRTINYE
jgi:hypothetical protein